MLSSERVQRAVDHMNEDHQDATLNIVHAFTEIKAAKSALMADILSDHIKVIAIDENDKEVECTIKLDAPIVTDDDIHMVIVNLAKAAHKKL